MYDILPVALYSILSLITPSSTKEVSNELKDGPTGFDLFKLKFKVFSCSSSADVTGLLEVTCKL